MIPPGNDIGSIRLGILRCRCKQFRVVPEPGYPQLGDLTEIEIFEFPVIILPGH